MGCGATGGSVDVLDVVVLLEVVVGVVQLARPSAQMAISPSHDACLVTTAAGISRTGDHFRTRPVARQRALSHRYHCLHLSRADEGPGPVTPRQPVRDTVPTPGTMREVKGMTGNPKRVYLHLPDNYFDVTEDEQLAVCGQIAQALIEQLGAPDKPPSETPRPWRS